jgi:DNA gyrase subunit A
VVASFPATDADQLMLVTDQGKLIRIRCDQIRIMGRGAQGVKLFTVADEEHVVSAAKITEDSDDDGDEVAGDGAAVDEAAVSAPAADQQPD